MRKIKWWGEGTATLFIFCGGGGTATLNRRFSKGHPEVLPKRFTSLLTILPPVLAYNSVKGTMPISFPDLNPVLTQEYLNNIHHFNNFKQFICMALIHIVLQPSTSRTFPFSQTKTLYPLNNNSVFPFLPRPGQLPFYSLSLWCWLTLVSCIFLQWCLFL